MKVLGIETSTKFLSVAVISGDKTLASFESRESLRHFDLIIPAIDNLLTKSGLKLKDLDAIALSIGPGSFTGLRIGVATVKGMNLALGVPIVAVPTLDAIAYNFIDEKEKILSPVIDAKKNKVYACFYEVKGGNLQKLTDYLLQDAANFIEGIREPALLFGDAVEVYAGLCAKNSFIEISKKEWFPKAETIARLGLLKVRNKKFDNPDKLVPMYLHSQYCQIKGYDV